MVGVRRPGLARPHECNLARIRHIGDGRDEHHCHPDVILGLVSDLWRVADKASERFAAQALDYDRYRPRYPDSVFDDLVESARLTLGDTVAEIEEAVRGD